VTTAHYVLLVAPQRGGGAGAGTVRPARLGLIVTRKIGVAVVRNRIKRVCRECFRLHPELLPDGVDLVVVARPGAEQLGLREVEAEWAAVGGLLRRRAQEARRDATDAANVPLAPDGTKAHVSRGPKPRARS
jgi:ribonuclease P protein component